MPRLIHIARYSLAVLGISDDEAIFPAVRLDPHILVGIGKGDVDGVHIKGKPRLMLGMARAGGIAVCLCLAAALYISVVKPRLIFI